MRWTSADVMAARERMAGKNPPKTYKRHASKYGNKSCARQGIKFDSEREASCWEQFELQRIMGAIRAVVLQVSLRLPGSRRRIRIDFMVVENDGRITWFDAKGVDTDKGQLKRKLIEDAYGITVHLI